MTEIIATLRYLHMAPRKVRLVARLVRGMDVSAAKAQLAGLPKRASLPLKKLLDSSIANATHNIGLTENDLYIARVLVNGGPMAKRTFPRSRGRADVKRKRTSHVTIILQDHGKENTSKTL